MITPGVWHTSALETNASKADTTFYCDDDLSWRHPLNEAARITNMRSTYEECIMGM